MAGEPKTFDCEIIRDILVVTPSAEFSQLRESEIRDAYNNVYRRLLDEDVLHIVFDFSRLEWFGSTFVGIMVRLAKQIRQGGGDAALCHMGENSQSLLRQLMLLENTKTDFFWTPFSTRNEAIEWLAGLPNEDESDEHSSDS